MRFNLPARVERFASIARLLGEDVAGMSQEQAAERARRGGSNDCGPTSRYRPACAISA